MLLGGIEAGGTKFICVVGNEFGEILERVEIKTTSPEETMGSVVKFFQDKPIKALGVGCFGPIELNSKSELYGHITSTPKVEWVNYDFVGQLKHFFSVPIGFDTDVNVACLGEAKFGQFRKKSSTLYLTIGTGIGGGAIVENNCVHGMLHPEMGHIYVRKHVSDKFEGVCPYHGDCLEGLASGTAIEARWGKKAEELSNVPEVWDLEAYYIAQAIVNYVLTMSPEVIILGGGVMKQKQLFPLIRQHVQVMLNGYVQKDEILKNIEQYIIPATLQDQSGAMGALALAQSLI